MISWDSVVTIVTRYKLDGPGTESWRWPHFLHLSRLVMEPTQPPTQWVSYTELKWWGHSLDHLAPSSAEIKERVEQYLCSPSGSSWPGLGWTLFYSKHNSIGRVMKHAMLDTVLCWIKLCSQIQGDTRNVIPSIVHVTHFYYYKSIWHLVQN